MNTGIGVKMKNTNRQKGISPSLSKSKETVSRLCKSPTISTTHKEDDSTGAIHHQKSMEHKHADSFLSDKEKYLRDNELEVEE